MSATAPALRLRPRFERVAPCRPGEVLDRLRAALSRPGAPCRGNVFGDHAVLYVLPAEERVWSPFLSLDVGWHPQGTCVRGLFGPKPAIWSLFVAAYAISLFGAVFAGGLAFVQWTLGQPAWAALGLVGLAGVAALVTWAFARYGQRRGQGQMSLLSGFLDDALAEEAHAG